MVNDRRSAVMKRHLLNKFGHPYVGAKVTAVEVRKPEWAVDREHLERFYVLKSDLHKFEAKLSDLENECDEELNALSYKVSALERECASRAELLTLDMRMGVAENNYVSLKTEHEALMNSAVADLRTAVETKCEEFETGLRELEAKAIKARVTGDKVQFFTDGETYRLDFVINDPKEPVVIAAQTEDGSTTFSAYNTRDDINVWHALKWDYRIEKMTDHEGYEIVWDNKSKKFKRLLPSAEEAEEEEDCPINPEPGDPCYKKPLFSIVLNEGEPTG